MKKIGILGGGQLGMLLAQSIAKLGAEALIYDPDPQAPACRTVRTCVNASWQDKEALSKFLSNCDCATYEFENVPYESIAGIKRSTLIMPGLDVLKTTQDRAKEKGFLNTNNLPHVPYFEANDVHSLTKKIGQLQFPVIIKSTTGGYDGKSQLFIQSRAEFDQALSKSASKPLPKFPVVVEEAIDLYMEVSCITACSQSGEKIVFPVFENVHNNHILDTTTVPANISAELASTIQRLASEATDKLAVVGILCTEFFIGHRKGSIKSACSVGDFNLYINEFAPRPHNSGHITMASCNISQFDILARVLLEIPLTMPTLSKTGGFAMANLLGDIWLAQGTKDGDKLNLAGLANQNESIDIILYGKERAQSGRKMGHLITQAATVKQAKDIALRVKEQLKKSTCLK